MAKPIDHAREARLAAKLRENLHRRKAQARALDTDRDEPGGYKADNGGTAKNDSGALSKLPPES